MQNEIDRIDPLGQRILSELTGPGSPPMEAAERASLSAGIQLACIGLKALVRIAMALEAHAPLRPSQDAHNAL